VKDAYIRVGGCEWRRHGSHATHVRRTDTRIYVPSVLLGATVFRDILAQANTPKLEAKHACIISLPPSLGYNECFQEEPTLPFKSQVLATKW
jgi:hypothetical protein